MRFHNPPPSRPSVFAGSSRSLLQSMLVPLIHLLRSPNVIVGTLPRVYPLRGSASLLVHHPMSNSDTICNGLSLPLVDIVLFGLTLSGFPSKFLKCAWESFPHSYKGYFVLLPNGCGISHCFLLILYSATWLSGCHSNCCILQMGLCKDQRHWVGMGRSHLVIQYCHLLPT